MTTHVIDFRAVSTICAHVDHLLCTAFKRTRLYGEKFEVLSDPSLEADGAAVRMMKRQRLKYSHPATSRDCASERKKGERFNGALPC